MTSLCHRHFRLHKKIILINCRHRSETRHQISKTDATDEGCFHQRISQCRSVKQKNTGKQKIRWFGHAERGDENYLGKRLGTLYIMDKNKRGRPKPKWNNIVTENLTEKGWRTEARIFTT